MNELLLIKNKSKTILHIDGDAFFVGVEIAKNPKLKGLPVVTGEERGIVSALSYEAKALGIVRGMPIFKVKRDFPSVIILPGDYASYVKYSHKMFEIVGRYADDIEEYSIDECFADFTGLDRLLKMTYLQIAERIKKEINEELALSVSLGLGPSKVLAKVASKFIKPNGLTVITSDTISSFLSKTPIEKIWGIGPRTSETLKRRGIRSAYDFIQKDYEWVKANFSKPYEIIWQELNGVSMIKVDSEKKTTYSSMQRTRSFHPSTNNRTFLLSQLSKHIEDACTKARYYNLVPKKLSVFLKSKDFKYSYVSIPIQFPTSAPEILIGLVNDKFKEIYRDGILYRTTGVILQDLADKLVQADLFGNIDKVNKLESIHESIAHLEQKFGRHVVYLGSTHNALNREEMGTDSEEPDTNLLFL